MAERQNFGSISRTLLEPQHTKQGTLRLRHILAEDGCKESQVSLAKSLLTASTDSPEDRSFNAQIAVYWLLKAAQKGQQEAFALLKNCSSSGVGVSGSNYYEIEKCLKLTREEIISRRVAFAVFQAIMSDTEDILPGDMFQEKVDLILKEGPKPKTSSDSDEELLVKLQQSTNKIQTADSSTPSVSFGDVVSSVQSCLEGNVPLVSLQQFPDYAEYRKKLTKYLKMLCNFLMQSTENLVFNLGSLTLPYCALTVILFLQLFSSFLPINTFGDVYQNQMLFSVLTFFFLTMLSFTCFIIHMSFCGDNFTKWLHLVKLFEPNIKSSVIEKKYLSKTTYPLITFFIVTFMYITLLPTNSFPKMFKDIGLLSCILAYIIDRTVSEKRRYVNTSLTLNIIFCLSKSNALQLYLPFWLSWLNNSIQYEIVQNIHINISCISCFVFIFPYLLVRMSWGNRKYIHLVLLPHLLSLAWMNLATVHLAQTSSLDLIYSIFTWIVIFILSKYIGTFLTLVTYLFINAAFTLQDLSLDIIFYLVIFLILYLVALSLTSRLKASHDKLTWCSILCITAVFLSYQLTMPQTTIKKDVIPWEKYQTYCHHYAWYRTTAAEVQISCLPLKGREIAFEGTVTEISVSKSHNYAETIANFLPDPFNSWFTCGLGQSYQTCDFDSLKGVEKERCAMYQTLKLNPCHLGNWNNFKFKIRLEVSARTSPEVVIDVDHACLNFVLNLREGDSVQAIGVLESNIGSSLPNFRLKYAQCSSCYSNAAVCSSDIPSITGSSFSFKNVVWFYFSPFLTYRTN